MHTTPQKGCSSLENVHVKQFSIDMFYYLQKNAKRQKCFEVVSKKKHTESVVKYCYTIAVLHPLREQKCVKVTHVTEEQAANTKTSFQRLAAANGAIADKLRPDDDGLLSYARSSLMDGGKMPGLRRLDGGKTLGLWRLNGSKTSRIRQLAGGKMPSQRWLDVITMPGLLRGLPPNRRLGNYSWSLNNPSHPSVTRLSVGYNVARITDKLSGCMQGDIKIIHTSHDMFVSSWRDGFATVSWYNGPTTVTIKQPAHLESKYLVWTPLRSSYWEIPKKNSSLAASPGKIPTCENPLPRSHRELNPVRLCGKKRHTTPTAYLWLRVARPKRSPGDGTGCVYSMRPSYLASSPMTTAQRQGLRGPTTAAYGVHISRSAMHAE
ncbi:hypothetical protein PR048_010057 [Dryococelus australis]|uniref:Uncharacterized protein n=1 Tax=Dryococelus australis TaxID=614101 RepID=A0ABQ9I1N2_9NEOP|nr:hypothetical protein PR048_010057 [Dryococelus australis]